MTIWKEKNILIVEDEPMTYRLIEVMLKDTGANLDKADDGQKAINIIKKNKDKYDLILMDIGLPNVDGYTATKKIKKLNKNIPIIAQTAYSQKQHRLKCFESGCDDFIAKPYSSDELKDIIRKFF
jgi:CheY-like chemotaxis protein